MYVHWITFCTKLGQTLYKRLKKKSLYFQKKKLLWPYEVCHASFVTQY